MAEPIPLPVFADDPDAAVEYLRDEDPCFGRHYSSSADECRRCTAPMDDGGRVVLCREACRERSTGVADVGRLRYNPGSRDVWRMIRRGFTPVDVFRACAGDDPDDATARAAHRIMKRRWRYLEKKGIPGLPNLPDRETLVAALRDT